MKATILGQWEMELPEPVEGEPWFLDWVDGSPEHSGNHLTVSWLTFNAIKRYVDRAGIEVTAVKEYFGGIGAHALMMQNLFEPTDHTVTDFNPHSVAHMQEALPGSVRVWQADAYDPETVWPSDITVLDFGDLTVHKAQPHLERGKLLSDAFRLDPIAVTVTDIAARYLHLQKERYEKILGPGTCGSYEDYLEAYSRHLEKRFGVTMIEGNYTRWSAVMAFVPNGEHATHGQFHKLDPSTQPPGLTIEGREPKPKKEKQPRATQEPGAKRRPGRPRKEPGAKRRPGRPRKDEQVKIDLLDSTRLDQYFNFVVERHRVWEQRQEGTPGPWTADPILASRKFTNVFRVLDPGSQFIFDLDDCGFPRDTLMRLFLYRHTGRTEAWWHNAIDLGGFPLVGDLDDYLESWREYRAAGNTIFTGAYLVYPQSATPGSDKLDSILALTKRLFDPESPDDIVPDFLAAQTQRERFHVLRRNRGVADFMSMQILTDWGYTRFGDDREDEFVVPGPGARRGLMHIAVTGDQVSFLRFLHAELLMTEGVPTLDLGNSVRYPSIMDVQNTLCEFGKYVRYLESGKVGKPYQPAHPGSQPTPRTPAHWATSTR